LPLVQTSNDRTTLDIDNEGFADAKIVVISAIPANHCKTVAIKGAHWMYVGLSNGTREMMRSRFGTGGFRLGGVAHVWNAQVARTTNGILVKDITVLFDSKFACRNLGQNLGPFN